ncbi:phenylalanine--tRNA ligase subunit alpha [Candidatus Gracilibacteria bacterium]|jgi:phenylalanyl-tRNA synthetase alpha chain|nr:phenylalanine--tRNA ligase subunit alpha [Candidatus Gracilibacteria bacterium]
MQEILKKLEKEALESLEKADTLERTKEIEVQYMGRNGHLTMILRGMKDLSDEEKRVIGPLCNSTKNTLEEAFAKKIKTFEEEALAKELSKEFFDTTIPGSARPLGHIHALSQLQEEVEKIFSQMGFTVADGPEIESEYYNFEGLNIPKDHPARDMQDTFFIQEKNDEKHGRMVLRTQTSPVQIRMMEKYGAPLRLIVPGRVFRFEATDASHDSMFYQVEGLLIDKNISLAHLKGVLAEFLTRLFGKPVKVRFRPGYFPFVEPGLEVDFSCLLCEGKGCRVCKHSGWMEFMGAGMVHENVLKAGGINSKEYQGWAFGFGLTRLVMMRYGIDDIRLLTNGDLRFNKQF